MRMMTRGMKAEGTGLVGWLCCVLGGRGVAGAAREMEVLETLQLGQRKQVVLVRVGGERYLVGMGADSVDAIVRVDGVGEVPA